MSEKQTAWLTHCAAGVHHHLMWAILAIGVKNFNSAEKHLQLAQVDLDYSGVRRG